MLNLDFLNQQKLKNKDILFAQLRGYDNICLLNANDADVFDFIQVKQQILSPHMYNKYEI